jgi:hypothetical protein
MGPAGTAHRQLKGPEKLNKTFLLISMNTIITLIPVT